ncbi:hypothetical protein [Rheinheimera metallidurans]
MPQRHWYEPFKLFSYAILLLMALAIIYAFSISLLHWTGIAV